MADNKAFQKRANAALVMQSVRVHKNISRIDISRELNLDRSTITNIVSKLMELGLLVEISQGVSEKKGGRKPVLLGINPSFGLVLGLEIQVGTYRATLININGDIIWNREGTYFGDTDLYHCISTIYSELEDDIEKEGAPLLGVGIGIPGQINPTEGIILSSSPFFSPSANYREILETLFNIPVIMDNDANCCAWGVLQQRKDANIKNFLYTIIESHGYSSLKDAKDELGFGIVVNRELYYGSSYAAGEIIDNISKKKVSGDLKDYFNALMRRINDFIMFLNPSHIFLGGEFITHRELVLEVIENLKESGYWNRVDCEVVFSCHGEFEISFGAASMFIERLFKIPGVDKKGIGELNWDRLIGIRKEVYSEEP